MKTMKRRFTFMLAVLMLTACCFAPMGMKGQTRAQVTWTASAQGYSNGQSVTSATFNSVISATFVGGTYYNTGTAVRVYGGDSFTIAALNGYNITKIVITFGSGDNTNAITANNGSYSSGTWTGTASSVKFTVGGSSGHRRLAAFTVTYSGGVAWTVTLGDTNITLTEASVGAGVTLPSRNDVDPYTFVGWSTTNNGSNETTTNPTIISAGTYYPSANVTLYPVYRRYGGSQQVVTWKQTAMSSLTAGTYAITNSNGKAFNGVISGGNGGVTSTAFSFTNGVAYSAPEGTCELTFTASGSGFKIYDASNSRYLYATAKAADKLAWHSSESSYWRTTGTYWVYNANTAYLRGYSGQIRTYSSGDQNYQVYFVKKITTTTTYYY